MSATRPQLSALTGLRFFAALHVVFYHFGGSVLAGSPFWIRNMGSSGYVGVSLFFVLSGFILTYTYLGDHYSTNASLQRSDPPSLRPRLPFLDRRAFWIARFARIYPVYLLGILLAAPSTIKSVLAAHPGPAAAGWTAAYAIPALTLTQAWCPYTATFWNIPAWSLSDEAFFYLVFPFLAVPLVARMRDKTILPCALLLWVTGILFPIAYMITNPDRLADPLRYSPDAPWLSALKYGPLPRLPEFLLGVVVGRLYLRDVAIGRERPGAEISIFAAVAILIGLSISDRLPYPIVHNALFAPLFALLIYGLAHGGGPIGKVLSVPAIVLLGESSYALYILHLNSWPWAMRIIDRISLGATSTPWIAFLGYLVIVLPVTIIVFKFIETPSRKWFRRRLTAGGRNDTVSPLIS